MRGVAALAAAVATLQWTALSVALILFNKWLMGYGGFPYPLTLCALHMLTSFSIALVFCLLGYIETNLTLKQFVKFIVPMGLLFAAAICTGNEAVLYLSIPFIQMVKAWTPTVVLLLSTLAGLESLSCRLVSIVLITSSGVALAIYGELQFNMFGFCMILTSVVLEALRLVLVELLFSSNEVRLSGLSGVFYMSPVCFLAVVPVAYVFEGTKALDAVAAGQVQPHLLALNACCAFMLNVSSLVLVKATSALTLKVVGVFKDWIVIVISSIVFSSVVGKMQWVGYSVAFVGILMYTQHKYAQYLEKQDGDGKDTIPLLSSESDHSEPDEEEGKPFSGELSHNMVASAAHVSTGGTDDSSRPGRAPGAAD
ncbi:triose-phosphate transporter family-domain-containing protein [Pavlovales sp. CCMP2436]|nr:triose-phosphate transporter family-domain-containing protein [Pavlovales sp. CCMP2436]